MPGRFPDMAGTMANVDLAKTATDPHRWRDLEMDLKGIIEPQPGVVILTYNAKAVRATDEVYHALVIRTLQPAARPCRERSAAGPVEEPS